MILFFCVVQNFFLNMRKNTCQRYSERVENFSRTADVAQLVEHLVVAQVVVGSKPIIRPINFETCVIAGLFFWGILHQSQPSIYTTAFLG